MPLLRVIKAAVARQLVRPVNGRLVARLFRDRIPCRGVRVDTSDPAVADAIKASIFFRIYESAEQRLVSRLLRADLDVVECGASLGVVSAQILRRLGPGKRLVAVEANPRLLPALRKNLDLAGGAGRAEAVHAAVHYGAPEALLQFGAESTMGRVGDGAAGQSVRVPAATLGGLVRERGLGRYALVCDIEGAELSIALHDGEALRGCHQLVAELHACAEDGRAWAPDDLARLFEERHGLRLRARDGNVFAFERP